MTRKWCPGNNWKRGSELSICGKPTGNSRGGSAVATICTRKREKKITPSSSVKTTQNIESIVSDHFVVYYSQLKKNARAIDLAPLLAFPKFACGAPPFACITTCKCFLINCSSCPEIFLYKCLQDGNYLPVLTSRFNPLPWMGWDGWDRMGWNG